MKNSLLILGLVLSVLAVASAYPPYANEQYDYVEEQENDLAEEQQGNEMDEMTSQLAGMKESEVDEAIIQSLLAMIESDSKDDEDEPGQDEEGIAQWFRPPKARFFKSHSSRVHFCRRISRSRVSLLKCLRKYHRKRYG